MADEPGEASASAPKPKKLSLFMKPVFTKPSEDEEAVDFFSRSKDLFPKILAQKEERLKKKATKLERKRSSQSREASAGVKKRRTSGEAAESGHSVDSDEEHVRTSTSSTTPGSRRSRSKSAQAQRHQVSPTSLSSRYKKDLEAEKHKAEEQKVVNKGYISLSDSEDDSDRDVKPLKQSPRKPTTSAAALYSSPVRPRALTPEDDDRQLSEPEEFPELVARARERAKQKELARLSAQNTSSNTQDHSLAPEHDPVITILITSDIEGSTPLVVQRKLSQALRLVRQSWCDRQRFRGEPLDESVKANIFLTWKNKRLFDVTTCKAMGLKVDQNGRLHSKGDGVDEKGRVHLEAWTEELFNLHLKRLELDRRRLADPLSFEEEEQVPLEPVEEVPKTRLIVRAKNLPDFKTIVKPKTLVSKVMGAYAGFLTRHGKAGDADVSLYFDGDRLDPDVPCGEFDFEDMDVIEAHVG